MADITEERRKDTELRRFTAELAESDRRLRAIVASIPGYVFQAQQGPQGNYRYTFVSEGVRALGHAPARVLADPSLLEQAVLTERHPPTVPLPEPGGPLRIHERDFLVRLLNGSERWMHTRAVPHPMHDGGAIWDGITLDVTDHKRQEEMALRSERMVVLGALSVGVADAFDALLQDAASRIGSLEPLLASQPGGMEALQALRRLAGEGTRMRELLRHFAQRGSGKAGADDLPALLAELRDVAATFAGKPLHLNLRTAVGLWPAAADALRLQNALLSLVLNARDAVPDGGEISLAARNGTLDEAEAGAFGRPPGPYVRIAVTDNGAGMAADVLPHALEPLFSTKTDWAASGIPLHSVLRFAKVSGGHLWLTSAPGQGTQVHLLLPAKSRAQA